jgi:hypothetical protein
MIFSKPRLNTNGLESWKFIIDTKVFWLDEGFLSFDNEI